MIKCQKKIEILNKTKVQLIVPCLCKFIHVLKYDLKLPVMCIYATVTGTLISTLYRENPNAQLIFIEYKIKTLSQKFYLTLNYCKLPGSFWGQLFATRKFTTQRRQKLEKLSQPEVKGQTIYLTTSPINNILQGFKCLLTSKHVLDIEKKIDENSHIYVHLTQLSCTHVALTHEL